MAITQDVVVLNNPSDWSSLARRERTTSTGTHVRYSVNVTCTPVVTDFGVLKKMEATSAAIVSVLRKGIEGITAMASASTQHKRAMMSNAATNARYTGGKMGYMPPDGVSPQGRLFNDSGRLAQGLFARRNAEEDGFTVNVPAARLNPETAGGGEATVVRWWSQLVALVPAFKGGDALFGVKEVHDAVLADVDSAIYVATEAGKAALGRARIAFVTQIIRDAGKILTITG